ncbi:MAG: 16S rRNA (guanine(527)-N(7))-methyltransferase RsmG [Planctomycetota bacterium]|jgi:16S rRNA (guanine527-N7)-methyltransferase
MAGASASSPRERLRAVARARSYPGDAAALDVLLGYLERVLRRNAEVNLTAARDLGEAVDVLALTALAVGKVWSASPPPRLVVDLGSGNGLPGVVAALAWPSARVLLVERRRKKAAAVAACVGDSGIANAETVACDGRELLAHRPEVAAAVDLVTIRAVGTLERTTRIAVPWLAPGGRIAHWKGERLTPAEQEAGHALARAAGLRVAPELRFPDAYGPARIVIYERPPS